MVEYCTPGCTKYSAMLYELVSYCLCSSLLDFIITVAIDVTQPINAGYMIRSLLIGVICSNEMWLLDLNKNAVSIIESVAPIFIKYLSVSFIASVVLLFIVSSILMLLLFCGIDFNAAPNAHANTKSESSINAAVKYGGVSSLFNNKRIIGDSQNIAIINKLILALFISITVDMF